MSTTPHDRAAVRAMYAGLGLTVVATIVPLVDHATTDVLASHIQAGYPAYSQARIDAAASIYLGYLSAVGVLGIVGWLWTIRAVKANKRWPRATATAMFALGTAVALTNLLITDTSGDTGLPPLLALVGMVPCLAGLVAVVQLWKGSRPTLTTDQP